MKRIEGVPYYRYVVRFVLLTEKGSVRRKRVFYSPGEPWVRTEVSRALVDYYGLERIKPGSVTLRFAE